MGILRLTWVVLLSVGCAFAPGVLSSQQPAAAGAPASKPGAGKGKDAVKTENPPDGTGGDVDIISDTMGVDLGPYVQRVVPEIRKNWIRLMPESARPPVMKAGRVAVEFAILKDGRVTALKLVTSSGDEALDRAPQSAILESRPFPPLPSIFRGQYLMLRMRFHYNPPKAPVAPSSSAPSGKAAPAQAAAPPKNP